MNNHLLKNKRLMLTLPLLLATSLFLPIHVLPLAHAQLTGQVCITSSTTATSCPSSPPAIGPLTVGQTVSVGVFVQGSDPMNGFDIFVMADASVLNPTSASLGGLIHNPTSTLICVNDKSVQGTCGATPPSGAEGPGVVEVATFDGTGNNDCNGVPATAPPCSGMAFTITYSVVGPSSSSPLSYPSAPACSNSSVSSPANVCVLVSDNFGATLSETAQGATVSASVPAQASVCVIFPATAGSCSSLGPPTIPVTLGSTFTVGVFVGNSQPMNGFDIFIAADPTYLLPTAASLGNLISNPTATIVCINDVSVVGTCTTSPPGANGQGVVEVSTFDGTGSNECNNLAPCSGLAFSVTYQVTGKTPSTNLFYPTSGSCTFNSVSTPPNTCVTVLDNVGSPLSESISGGSALQTVFVDTTATTVICTPDPVVIGQSTTCLVQVGDTNVTAPTAPAILPTGFPTTDGFGVFSGVAQNACTLQPVNSVASQCFVGYLPLSVGSGTHNIGAFFSGDSAHQGSVDPPFPLQVIKATPSVNPFVVVDQTGGAVPVDGIPAGFGYTVHASTVLTGGYPAQGITGQVSYTYFTNGNCMGSGTSLNTQTIGGNNNVGSSSSVLPTALGSYSFLASYGGDGNDFATSTCVSFVVNNYDFSLSAPGVSVGPGLFSDVSITAMGLNNFCISGTCQVQFIQPTVPSGVKVQFVPNPITVTSVGGSASTTMRIFATAAVPAGSFTIVVKGTWEGLVTHTVNVVVTVTGAPPSITKVNWNHQLSLSLDGPQLWHLFITNPETTDINVVFRITGKSTTNPANTFDITCGSTCVNTARKGVNATPGLTPILVPANSIPKQIKIFYTLDPAFVNQNVKFTITIWITTATGTFYQPTNSFSGTFFVFP